MVHLKATKDRCKLNMSECYLQEEADYANYK